MVMNSSTSLSTLNVVYPSLTFSVDVIVGIFSDLGPDIDHIAGNALHHRSNTHEPVQNELNPLTRS
jgi:hypothetical protein